MTCATPENLNIAAKVDDVTKSLINAYKNANNRNTKTQILSLYAHKYSVSTLKKLHSPYGKLSTRQIRQARCHARILGSILEQKKHHRVRIDMSKVDHFIEFVNRPYFYQDVSYYWNAERRAHGYTVDDDQLVYAVLSGRKVRTPLAVPRYSRFLKSGKPLRESHYKVLTTLQLMNPLVSRWLKMIVDNLEKGGLERLK